MGPGAFRGSKAQDEGTLWVWKGEPGREEVEVNPNLIPWSANWMLNLKVL